MFIVRLSICIFLILIVSISAKVQIVFRYDDFSADIQGQRDGARQRLWDAEKQVDQLFERFEMPYVISVIPGHDSKDATLIWSTRGEFSVSRDPEKVLFLRHAKQQGRVEVAQHGYTHKRNTSVGHRPGEFREISYETQKMMIRYGKEIITQAMGGDQPTIFVPPWNAWDSSTARILDEEGYHVLSADRYYAYASDKKLIKLPFTATLQQLEQYLNENEQISAEGIIVVLYHPVELVPFPSVQEDYTGRYYYGIERFEKLLGQIALRSDVEVTSIQSLLQKQHLTHDRYRLSNRISKMHSFWHYLMPSHFLPGSRDWNLYLPAERYRNIYYSSFVILLIWLMALVSAGFCLNHIICWFSDKYWRAIVLSSTILFLCITVISEAMLIRQGYHITGIRAVPAMIAIGMIFGFILKSGTNLRLKNKILKQGNRL